MVNNLKSKKMKRTVQLTGILLMLILTCNMSLSAQRWMRDMADTTCMNHMRMSTDTLHRHGMGNKTWIGPARMYHMQKFMDHRGMYGMGRGMRPGQGFDMRKGYGPVHRDSIYGRQFGPGRMMLESIPNVTEKQKKEISDLMTKHQDEMKKLREEMQTRMQALTDSHRKNILNILTDEQKKFIESGSANNLKVPEKTK